VGLPFYSLLQQISWTLILLITTWLAQILTIFSLLMIFWHYYLKLMILFMFLV